MSYQCNNTGNCPGCSDCQTPEQILEKSNKIDVLVHQFIDDHLDNDWDVNIFLLYDHVSKGMGYDPNVWDESLESSVSQSAIEYVISKLKK